MYKKKEHEFTEFSRTFGKMTLINLIYWTKLKN